MRSILQFDMGGSVTKFDAGDRPPVLSANTSIPPGGRTWNFAPAQRPLSLFIFNDELQSGATQPLAVTVYEGATVVATFSVPPNASFMVPISKLASSVNITHADLVQSVVTFIAVF